MACDLWNSTKKVQFEFLHLSEPPSAFSDQNSDLSQEGQKVADRKNRKFLFFKKIQLKGLVLQIRAFGAEKWI